MKPARMIPLATASALLVALAAALPAAERERDSNSNRRRSSNGGSSSSASAAPTAGATTGAAVSPTSLEAFALISERNIFNPNRIGRTRATSEEKAPRVDEISLVGTMQYDRGVVAFFDSPDSDFRKTLRVGESVADFKVEKIAADGVELIRADKPLSLKVSQQLRRAEGGDWNVITLVPAAAVGDTRGAGRGEMLRPSEAAPVTEVPADASEALKRLMEKRKKQLQK